MKITKYGHSCLLIEVGSVAILSDPGMWNSFPDADRIDAILLTHEHQDHSDIDQLKALIQKHPQVRILTHAGVGKKLDEASIVYETMGSGDVVQVNGVAVESCGTEHAVIYGAIPCQNTGFLIADELFITGDSLHDIPSKPVRVLALPTGGPWMKLGEAIEYAKKVKPEVVFPVHDALYIEEVQRGMIPRMVSMHLEPVGIAFVDLAAGATYEF